jgi:hypothetical protein
MVNGERYGMLFVISYTLYVKHRPITRFSLTSDFRSLTSFLFPRLARLASYSLLHAMLYSICPIRSARQRIH